MRFSDNLVYSDWTYLGDGHGSIKYLSPEAMNYFKHEHVQNQVMRCIFHK